MKIIGLEEHFVTAEVLSAWRALDPQWQDLSLEQSSRGESGRCLLDLSEGRLEAMQESGLDVQVVSLTAPGVQNLEAAEAVTLQMAANDVLAAAVHAYPERLQGLATLATPAPNQAASELERAVTKLGFRGAILFGRTRERNVDHPDFWPIFEAAATLRAPLYLHPQSPVPAVRTAYYSGLGDAVDAAFASYGLGWDYETGVQLMRLILSGVFDHFPELQVIVGHWGELVLFYLERMEPLAKAAKLALPVSEYFRRNVYVTAGGMLSQRYLRWATEIVGVERILFATDYPFAPIPPGGSRRFLTEAELSEADREKIASGNWERLCASIRR